MRRREFIALLGGAVTAAHAPLARRSQQSRWSATWQPRPGSQCCRTQRNLSVAWSRWGLARAATLTIDYRWAEGHFDRLPALAAELARDQVAVIFANGGAPVARAAMAATASIPIVFSIGDDPVRVGLVDNINRPTGNVTGATINFTLLGAKRWELLHEMVPKVAVAAVLIDQDGPSSVLEGRRVEEAARATGGRALIINARGVGIESAFATSVNEHADALFVTAAPFLTQNRQQIVALAARQPTQKAAPHFACSGMRARPSGLADHMSARQRSPERFTLPVDAAGDSDGARDLKVWPVPA